MFCVIFIAYHHHCIPRSFCSGFDLTPGIRDYNVVHFHPGAGIIGVSVVPSRNESGFYYDFHGIDEPVLLI